MLVDTIVLSAIFFEARDPTVLNYVV